MTDLSEFEPWPSIARLNRDMIITEKIDGTNAQISIREAPFPEGLHDSPARLEDGTIVQVRAGSRKRWISPQDDNYGFAAWVCNNAGILARTLGVGRHYGEWWGQGIQRRYDMDTKRFSLFNVKRWFIEDEGAVAIERAIQAGLEIDTVPLLFHGTWGNDQIDAELQALREFGSLATKFDNPEGIVVLHLASRTPFKILLENDHIPKSLAS